MNPTSAIPSGLVRELTSTVSEVVLLWPYGTI